MRIRSRQLRFPPTPLPLRLWPDFPLHMDTTNPFPPRQSAKPESARADKGPWLFDVSALLNWYTYHDNVTGIARAVERLTTADAIAGDPRVRFVFRVDGMTGFIAVGSRSVAGLGRPAERAAALAGLREAYGNVLRRRRGTSWRRHAAGGDILPGRGDVLVNLAEFWAYADQGDAYRDVKMAGGGRLVQFVYDIIPETHPHLCYDDHNSRFRGALKTIAGIADGFLCDSRHVQGELKRYLAGIGAPAPPTAVVPFGWDFAAPAGDGDTLERLGLARGRYILQVGTLEPRKNHLMVVRALHALYSRLGDRLPVTVFAGKIGWKTEALLGELTAINYLGGRIRLVHDASDADLAALYRNCRFSTFPSYIEGWGLPVQECLYFGRPCLASNATSVPEVGGDLAGYIDPYDVPRFTDTLERWIVDDAHIDAMAARIAAAIRQPRPTWNDSARTVIDFLERLPPRA